MTNDTNVTCTDVATDATCNLSIQTLTCNGKPQNIIIIPKCPGNYY